MNDHPEKKASSGLLSNLMDELEPTPLIDNKLFAAVDIGSNSIHLMVARISKGALQTVQSYRERVQLAAGLSADKVLDQASIDRGIACLERMGNVLSDYALDKVRVVATHTVRAAKNQAEFIERAEAALGFPVDVISGPEEARIIYLGAAHSRTLDEDTMIIDIGGGSTEIAIGQGFDLKAGVSCAMGCVSFRNRYFLEGCGKKEFKTSQIAVLQQLEVYLGTLKKFTWKKVYATSGTAKALGKVIGQFLPELQVKGEAKNTIHIKSLKQLQIQIMDQGLGCLAEFPLGEQRLPLVPSGLSILITLMQALDIEEISYLDVALREGVLYELDSDMRHANIKQRTLTSLHARYQVDEQQARRVASSAGWIFEQCLTGKVQNRLVATKDILIQAALLHEVGLQISAGGIHRHSAYILSHSDLPGYSQVEQELLAWLVQRYRKRINLEGIDHFKQIKASDLLALVAVFRFAVLFTISRRDVSLDQINLRIDKDIRCEVPETFIEENPLVEADLLREQQYWRSLDYSFELIIIPKT